MCRRYSFKVDERFVVEIQYDICSYTVTDYLRNEVQINLYIKIEVHYLLLWLCETKHIFSPIDKLWYSTLHALYLFIERLQFLATRNYSAFQTMIKRDLTLHGNKKYKPSYNVLYQISFLHTVKMMMKINRNWRQYISFIIRHTNITKAKIST